MRATKARKTAMKKAGSTNVRTARRTALRNFFVIHPIYVSGNMVRSRS